MPRLARRELSSSMACRLVRASASERRRKQEAETRRSPARRAQTWYQEDCIARISSVCDCTNDRQLSSHCCVGSCIPSRSTWCLESVSLGMVLSCQPSCEMVCFAQEEWRPHLNSSARHPCASPSPPVDGSDRSRAWLDGSTSPIEERSESLSMTWKHSRDVGPTVGWPVPQQ